MNLHEVSFMIIRWILIILGIFLIFRFCRSLGEAGFLVFVLISVIVILMWYIYKPEDFKE